MMSSSPRSHGLHGDRSEAANLDRILQPHGEGEGGKSQPPELDDELMGADPQQLEGAGRVGSYGQPQRHSLDDDVRDRRPGLLRPDNPSYHPALGLTPHGGGSRYHQQ